VHTSRAGLSPAFCSDCGYPPMGRRRSLGHRVCTRCQTGTVLRAPPDFQTRFYEPFVIVDPRLRLQGVSHHAELTSAVDEPAVIDVPLEVFRLCPTDQDQIDLAGCGPPRAAALIFTPPRTPDTRRRAAVADRTLAG